MTEELKVKIVVDDSDIKKVEKSLQSVTTGSQGHAKATESAKASMEELADSMQHIKSMGFFGAAVAGMKGLAKHSEATKKQLAAMKSHFADAAYEMKLGFNKKHWKDLGFDGSTWQNVKTMSGEAIGSIREGLKHATKAASEFGAGMKAALSTTIAKAAVLVTLLLSIVGLTRNALRTSLLGKQMNVLAQQAGMSVDAYQRWAFVLNQVGLEVDDMIGAQQTLLEAQMDVREGSEEMIEYFRKIGISQKEVLGMNQQQLFERTVEGLQNVENATERASIAYKLLSEDSKNLAPLLNLTAQEVATLAHNFNTLNGAMSEGLIKSSNRLQASLGNLKAAWQGLKNTLTELVLPAVIAVVNWLTKAIAIVNLFLRTVFGLDIGGAASSGVENAADSMGGYTESVDKATGAVAKLKRTLMGFDELNVVGNPNSGGSGSGDAGAGSDWGGFGGGVTESLFGADKLDMSKYQEWFAKYKNLIQDITTWGLIGIGITLGVIGGLTGNIPLILTGIALAGLGIAVGNVDGGTFDRLRQKFEETNLKIIPAAMVGIGAAGAVVCLLSGNIPGAIAFAAMAGIGLAFGGGDYLKGYFDKYSTQIQTIIAPSMIGVGAVVAPLALMTGNIPLAIAGLALIGAGLALGGLANGSIKGFINDYKDEIARAVTIAVTAASTLACIICLLTGNIPGAIAFGALAGLGMAQLGTGGTFFEDALNVIKSMWDGLKKWFNSEIKPVFTKAYWDEKWKHIKDSASQKLNEAKTTITNRWGEVKTWWAGGPGKIFTKEYWLNKFNTIKTGINTKLGEARTSIMNGWNNIKAYWTSNIAPKFTRAYWAAKFDTFRAALNEKIGNARTAIMNGWNNIRSYFTANIAPKFTKAYWVNKFDTMRAAASEKITAAKTALQNGWNQTVSWFNTSVKPKFTVTYWQNKFNTIKDGAKASFNGIISIVEKAVNNIVNKINTLKWTVPDWVPGIGGKKWGFNLKTVTIPRLATGGIATRSTVANIGEAGREAILPLDNNTGWMDKLADRIAARNGTPSKIVLKIGEKELGWASINGINQITKQTGELQLVL